MNRKLESNILFYENNKMRNFLNNIGVDDSIIDNIIINNNGSKTFVKSIIYETLSREKDYLESDFIENDKLFNI